MADRTFSHRRRVIINTDAKNEADDQFAIVHALLSPSLDIRGLVAAHFGNRRTRSSLEESRAEIELLLRLMKLDGRVPVADGAPYALPDAGTPVPAPGVELIVEEAMRDVAEPLYVAFLGPLTDMASALMLEPRIAERDVTVIWIGGGGYDGVGPQNGRPEFNLSNDIVAANLVFSSALKVWQVPAPTYRMMAVGYAELDAKVAPCGEVGEYLVRQLVEWNERQHGGSIEFRVLGDSPAIGLMLHPDCGTWVERPAPAFRYDGTYDFSAAEDASRPIRVYGSIDARFIHEDFFAKLRAFADHR
ncbi:nucleoside hydrolase [Nonomuraea rubra]|uniref:Inosine-uridine nucleoside N-ribohydrolase n=1 Tax=Nonomuraea rubra TaxID=46180 RepID=A0A7X0U3P6_9ACTN|nr:nucleoside hydrolase [Nonomuraea rubra]MBB6553918.1 inosine-uridine nucleoside N-ribohydrolase [Nonomuraea rubra]